MAQFSVSAGCSAKWRSKANIIPTNEEKVWEIAEAQRLKVSPVLTKNYETKGCISVLQFGIIFVSVNAGEKTRHFTFDVIFLINSAGVADKNLL